jgi:hypothetical protein
VNPRPFARGHALNLWLDAVQIAQLFLISLAAGGGVTGWLWLVPLLALAHSRL